MSEVNQPSTNNNMTHHTPDSKSELGLQPDKTSTLQNSINDQGLNHTIPNDTIQETPHRSSRTNSCEFIHHDHHMRHHCTRSPGVDSLEVSALTGTPQSNISPGPIQFTSTPRDRSESSCSHCSTVTKCSSAPCERIRTLSPGDGSGEGVKVPIVGYEVMEQREKFTVFKIHVVKSQYESWFIFRRYTDFVRLNEKLSVLFPYFRLALPPKRWFSDNFDTDFLEDRMLGLQAFIDNITGHRDILNSKTVIEFFCLEDPPGPHDSLEESRAMCQSLEDTLYSLKQDIKDKDSTIELLREQLALQAAQLDHLNKSLRVERSLNGKRISPKRVESPLAQGIRRKSADSRNSESLSPKRVESPLAAESRCISADNQNSESPSSLKGVESPLIQDVSGKSTGSQNNEPPLSGDPVCEHTESQIKTKTEEIHVNDPVACSNGES